MAMETAVPLATGKARAERVPVKVVAATVAGNALEFFDFIAYNFFAVYIGKTFFPTSNPMTSLLLSVGVFGVGFLFRPLGGVLIGAYADRAGRKPAMLLTIVLITVGTIGLAVTPSYATIGIAAPLIVVFCRLVQGLALGGEVGPASVFLIEIAPPNKRAFYSSWQLASQGLAALAASGLGMILSLALAPAELEAWGWRVPFLLCLVLVPVALYLRHAMPETLEQGEVRAKADAERPSLRSQSAFIVLAVLVILGGTVSTYAANYMTTYGLTTLHLPPSTAFAATVLGGAATFLLSLLGGWLADRHGRRAVMLWPRLVLTVATWPLFLLLQAYPTALMLCVTTVVMMGLTALGGAAAFAAIPELLPRSVRATGVAIGYAIGVSVFGGSTQFVITWLLGVTKDPTSPAWYVTATSVISLVATWFVRESRGRKL
ncbi:Predicted arabinose efflux permease, MFS family [Enhydrobacter aerosaccus]|uniref:Predicted arabinose efflux permease, MFS family n=1 Tax=Enhydrobacter aerosaccus TaxID=225324 RepID=A0A1T4LL45_9HYPH|nr:MFS transporter [Enhydrobacter aerosaccus]SJZ55381.1 Predicted arabinose efflux permease, MFS family [Enhydrobacter aerosaccus]